MIKSLFIGESYKALYDKTLLGDKKYAGNIIHLYAYDRAPLGGGYLLNHHLYFNTLYLFIIGYMEYSSIFSLSLLTTGKRDNNIPTTLNGGLSCTPK